eukprot:m.229979 g.229979  ORF g.229979 m.229979 type:complete len:1784 (-) comp13889_c0_seq1:72-5423(-)
MGSLEGELENQPWYFPTITQQEVEDALQNQLFGTFLVSWSSRDMRNVLSVRCNQFASQIAIHYPIIRNDRTKMVYVENSTVEFETTMTLLRYHMESSTLQVPPLHPLDVQRGGRDLSVHSQNSQVRKSDVIDFTPPPPYPRDGPRDSFSNNFRNNFSANTTDSRFSTATSSSSTTTTTTTTNANETSFPSNSSTWSNMPISQPPPSFSGIGSHLSFSRVFASTDDNTTSTDDDLTNEGKVPLVEFPTQLPSLMLVSIQNIKEVETEGLVRNGYRKVRGKQFKLSHVYFHPTSIKIFSLPNKKGRISAREFQFKPYKHLTVSNKKSVTVFNSKTLFKLSLRQPSQKRIVSEMYQNEMELKRYSQVRFLEYKKQLCIESPKSLELKDILIEEKYNKEKKLMELREQLVNQNWRYEWFQATLDVSTRWDEHNNGPRIHNFLCQHLSFSNRLEKSCFHPSHPQVWRRIWQEWLCNKSAEDIVKRAYDIFSSFHEIGMEEGAPQPRLHLVFMHFLQAMFLNPIFRTCFLSLNFDQGIACWITPSMEILVEKVTNSKYNRKDQLEVNDPIAPFAEAWGEKQDTFSTLVVWVFETILGLTTRGDEEEGNEWVKVMLVAFGFCAPSSPMAIDEVTIANESSVYEKKSGIKLTTEEDIMGFFNSSFLARCITMSAFTEKRNGFDLYLNYLMHTPSTMLAHVQDFNNSSYCLLQPVVNIKDIHQQTQIAVMFCEKGAMHVRMFSVFFQHCVKEDELSSFLKMCQNVFTRAAVFIPTAPRTLFNVLKEDSTIKSEQRSIVMETISLMLGQDKSFFNAFVCTPEDATYHLQSVLDEYARNWFRKLVTFNKFWFQDDKEAQKDLQNELDNKNGNALARHQYQVQALVSGLLFISLQLQIYDPLRSWGDGLPQGLFRAFFTAQQRGFVVDTLNRRLSLFPECEQGIIDGSIMNNASFFDESCFKALSKEHGAVAHKKLKHQFFSLVTLADKLLDYEHLSEALNYIASTITPQREDTMLKSIQRICDELNKRPPFELVDGNKGVLSLENVGQCVVSAVKAMSLIQFARGKMLLQGCVDHYLGTCTPSTWLDLFKKLDVIAFFIKYLARESHPQSLTAFEESNHSKPWVLELLDDVRKVFSQPLIDVSRLKEQDEHSQDLLIKEVGDMASNYNGSDMEFIYEFSSKWMKRMKEMVSIPMTPHNTQIISCLLFSTFYKKQQQGQRIVINEKLTSSLRGDDDDDDDVPTRGSVCKSLIVEMGTGEGKSVAIVMAALYFVIYHGKRIHILENNKSLRNRDFNNYKDFIRSFKKKKGSGGSVTVGKNPSSKDDICYCLSSDIDSLHRSEAPEGRNPFADVILLADEVDDLIIDSDPTTAYVRHDNDHSRWVGRCFEALKQSGVNASMPNGCPTMIWNKSKSARSAVASWREGKDVGFDGTKFRILDSRGRITTFTSMTLQYYNYINGYNSNPNFESVYYVVSTPHIFSQYHMLFGLTGSVGGKAELRYVRDTYKAGVAIIPPFLNTCIDTKKVEPAIGRIQITSNTLDQYSEVAKAAKQKMNSVPVLIICKKPDEAKKMAQQVRREVGAGMSQLFLEYVDKKSQHDEWDKIVDLATQPIENERSELVWRVTITDYFGGRGHDYKVSDEGVNDAGGMLVIITHIPDSNREWVQWKGRTARQDRNGQLLLVLDKSDEFLSKNLSLVSKFSGGEVSKEEFVHLLLEKRNENLRRVLADYSENQTKGMMLNELFDRFFRKYGSASNWPASDNHRKMRDFYYKHSGTPTRQSVLQLAKELGIADGFPY